MTATALHTTAGDVSGVPLARLVRAELRKLVDTRAGVWLLAGIAVVGVAAVGISFFATDPADQTYGHFVNMMVLPQALLMPVLGILTVTTEWTHRTGLVTHTLEPRRGRVVVAKLAAIGVLGLLAVLVALGVGAVGNVLGSVLVDGDGSWDYGAAGLRNTLLYVALSLVHGFAMGALLMNTAAAIVVYFVLPTAFGLVFGLVERLRDVAPWIDLATAQDPLFFHSIDGVEWLQLLATSVWWILLPLAAGLWRLLHREIA